jgi:phosphinothricin acetyltransferase
MLGWTALSPVSSRCVYSGVAEVSIYVATIARGKGIGEMLLNELISKVSQMKYGHYNLDICRKHL